MSFFGLLYELWDQHHDEVAAAVYKFTFPCLCAFVSGFLLCVIIKRRASTSDKPSNSTLIRTVPERTKCECLLISSQHVWNVDPIDIVARDGEIAERTVSNYTAPNPLGDDDLLQHKHMCMTQRDLAEVKSGQSETDGEFGIDRDLPVDHVSVEGGHKEEGDSINISNNLATDITATDTRSDVSQDPLCEYAMCDSAECLQELKSIEPDCLQEMFQTNKQSVELVFEYYRKYVSGVATGAHGTSVTARKHTQSLDYTTLVKFALDFELLPSICSRRLLHTVYRQCIGPTKQQNQAEGFSSSDQFASFLVQLGVAIFGRKAFGSQLPTRSEQIAELFKWLWSSKSFRQLEAESSKRRRSEQNVLQRRKSSSPTNAYKLGLRRLPFAASPDSTELDCWPHEETRLVFEHYCSFGNPTNLEWMSSSKFYKLTKESGLQGPLLDHADVDIIFMKSAKESSLEEIRLSYDGFCKALILIAAKLSGVSEHDTVVDAASSESQSLLRQLREILLLHILPLAHDLRPVRTSRLSASPLSPSSISDGGTTAVSFEDPEAVAEAVVALDERGSILQMMFGHYVLSDDAVLTWQSFLECCSDFDILPKLCSKGTLRRIFSDPTSVHSTSTLSPPSPGLSYCDFVRCIAKVALIGFSKPYLKNHYVTASEKAGALLGWVEACDALAAVQSEAWQRGHTYRGRRLSSIQLMAKRQVHHRTSNTSDDGSYVENVESHGRELVESSPSLASEFFSSRLLSPSSARHTSCTSSSSPHSNLKYAPQRSSDFKRGSLLQPSGRSSLTITSSPPSQFLSI